VAIWNDEPYDRKAIFTGSATVLEDGPNAGLPVQVYPGLCTTNKALWPSCETGTNIALAVPADHENDVFLVNWTKSNFELNGKRVVNPVVNNTQRDPSTAWRNPLTGEYQFTTFDGRVYVSEDFASWTMLDGFQPGFPKGQECPSFFKLPLANRSMEDTGLWVHKSSIRGRDWI